MTEDLRDAPTGDAPPAEPPEPPRRGGGGGHRREPEPNPHRLGDAMRTVLRGLGELMVTADAATTMIMRRRVTRSTSAPSGVWNTRPAIPAMVMTAPTVASFQPCDGPRTARR